MGDSVRLLTLGVTLDLLQQLQKDRRNAVSTISIGERVHIAKVAFDTQMPQTHGEDDTLPKFAVPTSISEIENRPAHFIHDYIVSSHPDTDLKTKSDVPSLHTRTKIGDTVISPSKLVFARNMYREVRKDILHITPSILPPVLSVMVDIVKQRSEWNRYITSIAKERASKKRKRRSLQSDHAHRRTKMILHETKTNPSVLQKITYRRNLGNAAMLFHLYSSTHGSATDVYIDALHERNREAIEIIQFSESRRQEILCQSLVETGERIIAMRNTDLTRLQNTKIGRKCLDLESGQNAPKVLVDTEDTGERALYAFIERFNGGFFFKNQQIFFEGFQCLFINAVIPKLAANIVGSNWSIVGPRICREFGWTPDDFNHVMIAVTPRRFGKTVGISVLVANYALAKSPCEIAVFSTGKRISRLMQNKIRSILIESGYMSWIVKDSVEKLFLRDPNNPDDQLRQIYFYPSSTVCKIYISCMFACLCICICVFISKKGWKEEVWDTVTKT